MTDEFALIDKYFAPLSEDIGDDCAILEFAEGERLATSVDTQVEGVHFHTDAPPDQVAYRSVVTALSDLAAAGAEPRAITLALTLPEANDSWLQQFSRGLQQALNTYEVALIGGDTTAGPLTVTVQVMGVVPAEQALTRAGARVGDKLYISGTTGDAAAAIAVMDGQWPGRSQHKEYLLKRFYRPTARVELGRNLLSVASSAIDVSDGVLADAGHLCEQSGVGIRIDADRLPLSPALKSLPDQHQARAWALGGGDDYELLFTVPAGQVDQVPATCTCIGEVVEGDRVLCDFELDSPGYTHFSRHPPTPMGSEGVRDSVDNLPRPRPFRSLVQFLAFGFGSGLAPKAPGTAGTLVAVPLYLLASELNLVAYSALLLVACLAGIWICGRASRELKVHDHPGIVWDEFAGFWITMWALPTTWYTVVAGFALFRLFDILKPWPIRFYDRTLGGGLGIMLDDILAGIASCALLHGALYLLALA